MTTSVRCRLWYCCLIGGVMLILGSGLLFLCLLIWLRLSFLRKLGGVHWMPARTQLYLEFKAFQLEQELWLFTSPSYQLPTRVVTITLLLKSHVTTLNIYLLNSKWALFKRVTLSYFELTGRYLHWSVNQNSWHRVALSARQGTWIDTILDTQLVKGRERVLQFTSKSPEKGRKVDSESSVLSRWQWELQSWLYSHNLETFNDWHAFRNSPHTTQPSTKVPSSSVLDFLSLDLQLSCHIRYPNRTWQVDVGGDLRLGYDVSFCANYSLGIDDNH